MDQEHVVGGADSNCGAPDNHVRYRGRLSHHPAAAKASQESCEKATAKTDRSTR